MVEERRTAYDIPAGKGPNNTHVSAASQLVNDNVVVKAIPLSRGDPTRQDDLAQVIGLWWKQASRNIAQLCMPLICLVAQLETKAASVVTHTTCLARYGSLAFPLFAKRSDILVHIGSSLSLQLEMGLCIVRRRGPVVPVGLTERGIGTGWRHTGSGLGHR